LSTKPNDISREDIDTGIDWQTLDSRVATGVQEIEAALEEALAAIRDLNEWVERLHALSAFMQQVESGLAEVRHQLKEPPQARRSAAVPSTAPRAETVEVSEAPPLEPEEAEPEVGEETPLPALEVQEAESSPEPSQATAEAESRAEPSEATAEAESRVEPSEVTAEAEAKAEEPPAPAEGEPLEEPPSVAEVGGSIRLQIESSEANIDLMVVERALRETPGVADVDLLDYAGKRARVQVTFSERERAKEVADPERLAANVQERLAKLTWDGSLSVSATE
jgi:hypothetical protein